jgi:hypothetical protein
MEGAAFDELVEDIKLNGQLFPCLVSNSLFLDGRNRWRACEKLGIKPKIRAVEAQTNEDYVAIITSANVHRRHLTTEQKRQLCELALIEAPGLSNRRIAKATNLEHHTVAKIREKLETEGKIAAADERLGADGKMRTVRTAPDLTDAPDLPDAPDYTEADFPGLPETDEEIVHTLEPANVESFLNKLFSKTKSEFISVLAEATEACEPEPLTQPVDTNFNIEMRRLLDGLNALYQNTFERKRLLNETAALLKLWRADARAKKATSSTGERSPHNDVVARTRRVFGQQLFYLAFRLGSAGVVFLDRLRDSAS